MLVAAAGNTALQSVMPAIGREIGISDFWVTVSAGIADAIAVSGGTPDPHQLLVRADQALYSAKSGGRNKVRVWSERVSREKSPPARETRPPVER